MNEWNEKIYRDSIARDLCPGGFEDETAFTIGARWQREALLADDVIERAARALCVAAGENPDSNELWDEEPPWMYYTDEARAMLTAALGIEGDET